MCCFFRWNVIQYETRFFVLLSARFFLLLLKRWGWALSQIKAKIDTDRKRLYIFLHKSYLYVPGRAYDRFDLTQKWESDFFLVPFRIPKWKRILNYSQTTIRNIQAQCQYWFRCVAISVRNDFNNIRARTNKRDREEELKSVWRCFAMEQNRIEKYRNFSVWMCWLHISIELTFYHTMYSKSNDFNEKSLRNGISLCQLLLLRQSMCCLSFSANSYTCKSLCIIRHQLWHTIQVTIQHDFSDFCPLTIPTVDWYKQMPKNICIFQQLIELIWKLKNFLSNTSSLDI